MLKKGLIFGMVVLFLGMSITPLSQSISTGKEQSVMSKSCVDGIIIHGTMGENGWYVSDVVVTFDFPSYRIYFKIDGGTWQEYYGFPVVVCGDGMHTVDCYYIDSEGNVSPTYTISFKIDETPPIISLTVTAQNLLRTKWLISITAEDATSGVVLVEIYVDYELVCSMTTVPYEYSYQGKGHSIQALAYDGAGNVGDSGIISLLLVSQQSKSLQSNQQSIQLLQNLLVRQQMTNR